MLNDPQRQRAGAPLGVSVAALSEDKLVSIGTTAITCSATTASDGSAKRRPWSLCMESGSANSERVCGERGRVLLDYPGEIVECQKRGSAVGRG